jgi:benzoate/toluate 1,2-dioxygenase subunit alpha
MRATTLERNRDFANEREEQKGSMLNTIQKTLDTAVQDDPTSGVYRVSRDIFTDPEIYFTTYIGRQAIFIARDHDGELKAFINACSHRGAMLCRIKRGNRRVYTCPFRGWTFENSGKLLKVTNPEGAGYPDDFNTAGSHDLTKVARFESYRGFLFGSLNPNVPPLGAHLGEAAKFIDLIVDQTPDGLEVLRGSSTYVYDGNWKLQTENDADGYHVSTVHWNYVLTTERRKQAEQANNVRAINVSSLGKLGGGFYAFANGHLLLWADWANPEDRPNWEQREELAARFDPAGVDWMVRRLRNLYLYPNVYLMDQMSSQIRVCRPIVVDKTEVTIYCIAPRRESAEARARRIRQYEDFFNAGGMATPDDLEEFRRCQMAYLAVQRSGTTSPAAPGTRSRVRRGGQSNRSVAADERLGDRRRGRFPRPAQILARRIRRGLSAETRLDAKEQDDVVNA